MKFYTRVCVPRESGAQYIVRLFFIWFVVGERFRGGKWVTERGRNAK